MRGDFGVKIKVFVPPTNGSTACRPKGAYLATEGSTLVVSRGMSLKTISWKSGKGPARCSVFVPPQAQRSAYLVRGMSLKTDFNIEQIDIELDKFSSPHKRSEVPTWRPKEVPLWYSGNEFKNVVIFDSITKSLNAIVFVPPQAQRSAYLASAPQRCASQGMSLKTRIKGNPTDPCN